MKKWHALGADEVIEELETAREGLSDDSASRRLAEHGPNSLEAAEKEHPLRRLLRQFNDILIYILIIAAGLTAYLQEWVDTGVILAVVVVNAAIGFVQEGKAEEALEMIRKMLSLESTVIRGGSRRKIDAAELVPGDIIWLEAGDQVPADVRLIEAKDFEVEEALLTGESAPIQKVADPVSEEALLADRRSMAYSGTIVARGTARAVVVATGGATEVGRIGAMVADVKQLQTPLLKKIDRFGMWLSAIILVVSVLLFAFGFFARTYEVTELFMLVVSLAVAAIPEGLPAIMTITLALGVRHMAGHNAIVRRLPAVETLGSVTVICSDKTGTLTRNEMTAGQVLTAHRRLEVGAADGGLVGRFKSEGEAVDVSDDQVLTELARASGLCNDAQLQIGEGEKWSVDGEPTEAALMVLAARTGLKVDDEEKRFVRRDTIPFESQRRYMATLHDEPEGQRVIFLKGAPEKVVAMCSHQRVDGEDEPIDGDYWQRQSDRIADEGYRLLAIARRRVSADVDQIAAADIGEDFVLLGVVGLMDPPREEAIVAVEQARQAGIRVKMITGDHVKTAQSIGAKMGIGVGKEAITGRDLEDADDEELARLASEHDVFARTSPEHKLRIVTALQGQKEVVAMTGDGVNDAPALKRADVGVAMGIKGTEATKQAADMVLADDNFASIERAIHEGRTIYDNLKKTILFLLPTNGAEAFMVLAAVFLALEYLPITPVQILWVNMITAVTLALAIAFEPAEDGVMRRPPRPPNEPIVGGYSIVRIGVVALLIGSLSLAAFFGARAEGMSVELARTVAVNTLVAGQLFYLFSSRFLVDASYTPKALVANPVALGSAAALILFQIAFTYAPIFQTWFSTEAMFAGQWLQVVGAGLLVFVVVEFEKAVARNFFKGDGVLAPE